jgi:hypothetical protein
MAMTELAPTITGACHCGDVRWEMDGDTGPVTACNCTICRRYGALWGYDYDGERIRVEGATISYARGEAIDFHFCPRCGCIAFWRGRRLEQDGRRRIAVNVRLAEPDLVGQQPIDHFDGLDSFEDLPTSGKTVADLWA